MDQNRFTSLNLLYPGLLALILFSFGASSLAGNSASIRAEARVIPPVGAAVLAAGQVVAGSTENSIQVNYPDPSSVHVFMEIKQNGQATRCRPLSPPYGSALTESIYHSTFGISLEPSDLAPADTVYINVVTIDS